MRTLLPVMLLIALAMPQKVPGQLNVGADVYLDGILKKLRLQFDVPSLSATLVIDGKLVASGATGVKKFGSPAPVTDDDLFAIGSVTKTVTGFLAAKIIEQNSGTLSWDTRVRDLYPELAGLPGVNDAGLNSSFQTLNRMQAFVGLACLSHASCSMNNFNNVGCCQTGVIGVTETCSKADLASYRVCGRNEFVNKMMRLPVPPNVLDTYNNNTPVIVSAMLQRATNNTFEDLLRNLIFTPMGLSKAKLTSQVSDAEAPAMVYGHTGNIINDEYKGEGLRFHVGHASGGVMMTPKEMGTYLIELMPGAEGRANIISDQSLAAYFSGESGTGLRKVNGGWMKRGMTEIVTGNGITNESVYWHNGGHIGFGSDFLVIPSKKMGYACVSTGDGAVRAELQLQLVSMWYQKNFLPAIPVKSNATLSNASSLAALKDNDFLTTWTSGLVNDAIVAKPGGGRGPLSVPFKYILLAYPRNGHNIEKITIFAKGFNNSTSKLMEITDPGRDNTLFVLEHKTLATELTIQFTNKANKKTVLSEIRVIGLPNDRRISDPIEKIMDPIRLIKDPVMSDRIRVVSVEVPVHLRDMRKQ